MHRGIGMAYTICDCNECCKLAGITDADFVTRFGGIQEAPPPAGKAEPTLANPAAPVEQQACTVTFKAWLVKRKRAKQHASTEEAIKTVIAHVYPEISKRVMNGCDTFPPNLLIREILTKVKGIVVTPSMVEEEAAKIMGNL